MIDLAKKDFISNFFHILEKFNQVYQKIIEMQKNNSSVVTPINVNEIYNNLFKIMWQQPEKMIHLHTHLFNEHVKITNNVMERFMGNNNMPLYTENNKDKRFDDPLWNENAFYNYLKQIYIMVFNNVDSLLENLDLDPKQEKKVKFLLNQILNAFSPSNFLATNPKVLKETLASNGENIIKGLDNLINDLEEAKGLFKISTTNKNHFKVGENIATTPGKVIFQNDLMQLIQYSPVKEKNFEIPLLIIPAWINKFYILDLKENNSFVKWALTKGYTVFIISWVNPTKDLAHKNFEDYMMEGPITAIEKIKETIGVKQVNTIGYCIGGTLLSCALSYLKEKKDNSVNSSTFLTTIIDFEDCSDLSMFIDEEQLNILENHMEKQGYLDGNEMALTFSLLRANDLIWSFYVNNYLLGKEPFPFDLLYWNSDSTRLPYAMNSFYLRNMYKDNLLKEPEGITLANQKINLSKIDIPCYFLSTIEDHIAPWQSTYKTTNIFKGKLNFVLAGSGHIAGVINPPSKNKYYYLTNENIPYNCENWLKDAEKHDGSWWENWHNWSKQLSGKLIDSPDPCKGKLKVIEDAPGNYVKVKC